MPTPVELLSVIQTTLDDIQARDADFSAQQQPFVNHLVRTTSELHAKIDPIPQTDMALRRLIPRLGDELLQRIAALFGYARLLLDSPQSFDNATLTPQQASHLQTIYQHGKYLYDLVEAIQQSAHAERVENHKAPAEPIYVDNFMRSQQPILTYLLRDNPLELTIYKDDALVQASPYHLAALFDHIVITLVDECDFEGKIHFGHIYTYNPKSPVYRLYIHCQDGTLDRSVWDTLFAKNGRDLYLRRLEQYGGKLEMALIKNRGVIFGLDLPLTPKT
ncbi:MAG: hypothetical protein AAFR81_19110 [Chloroflexota bacterium]